MAARVTTTSSYSERKRPFVTRTDLLGYLFISPWIIGFLLFSLLPFIASFLLSFTDWNIVGQWNWVGVQNYAKMVSGVDDRFVVSLWNTLRYAVVVVPGGQIIALALAMLLNKKAPGIAVYRTLFYVPAIASGVGTAYLWAQILSSRGGLLNSGLDLVGIQGPNWLYSLTWSMPALMIVGLWNVGTPMLIYLAALQGVPQSLYDAASVDGANTLRKFFHVTIPMLTPAIFFNIVLGFIGAFQVFTIAYVITNGGPANTTLFYSLYLYQVAFRNLRMGYAAALAWVLFLIILAITIVQLLMARLWVYYEGSAPTVAGPR
ncbi:MAG TPA: sugar ABC transporter permease [Chloroflexota bacterium]|jgi:multiple sugar transport system permease protein